MQATEGILSAFRTHKFLSGLGEQQLMRLAAGVTPFTAQPGDYLAREGQRADAFYLIQDGVVEVLTRGPSGEPVIVRELGSGDVLGWSWLVPPHQWTFDARAQGCVRGLKFDGVWLRDLCETDRELGFCIVKYLLQVIGSRLAASRQALGRLGQSGAAALAQEQTLATRR
ncbi:MAG: Crp/Fnr family transcriptional regulator [Gemmataceae bacterium]